VGGSNVEGGSSRPVRATDDPTLPDVFPWTWVCLTTKAEDRPSA